MSLVTDFQAGIAPCDCELENYRCGLIAITGGPSAGKTAVLEFAQKTFCEHVIVLPEAASIVFGGGFWRRSSDAGMRGAQRAIFHIQKELERTLQEEQVAAIGLCDRGTLDGLAYWPGKEEEYWKEVESDKKTELARYQAVIHLRSPTLDNGYSHDSNPVRTESAKEAQAIDQRIVEAWSDHPNRILIDSTVDFFEKARRALEVIRAALPECCHLHKIPNLSGEGHGS